MSLSVKNSLSSTAPLLTHSLPSLQPSVSSAPLFDLIRAKLPLLRQVSNGAALVRLRPIHAPFFKNKLGPLSIAGPATSSSSKALTLLNFTSREISNRVEVRVKTLTHKNARALTGLPTIVPIFTQFHCSGYKDRRRDQKKLKGSLQPLRLNKKVTPVTRAVLSAPLPRSMIIYGSYLRIAG